MGKNVAVFVDVANIFYAAKAAGVDIDYVTLLKSASAGRDLVRAYAYTGLDPDNENQRNFHDFLRRSNYKVVSKDIRKYGDGKVKANLDIELVVDMMKTARNLDIAIIVSGDGDFAPAIRAVQEQGVRVEVISFRGNTSSDLIEAADQFTDIIQLARVEKGSRSGRRVAEGDDADLSMTEVPDKLTEGTGAGRGRGRGRGRDAEPVPAAARGRSRSRPMPVAAADGAVRSQPAGGLVALPGERLSRSAGTLTEADMASAEVFTLDDLEDAGAVRVDGAPDGPDGRDERAEDGEGPRRRRRRGGRGRGRGRGRGEDGQFEGESDGTPERAPGAASTPSVAASAPVAATGSPMRDQDQDQDDEVQPAPAPRGPRPTPFGSFWDSQIGTPTNAASAPRAPLVDEEDFDEPEIPEYLIAEQRRSGNRGDASGGRGARGGRSAYQSAMERERFGRGGGGGGINRYPDVSARTQPTTPPRDERNVGRGDRTPARTPARTPVPSVSRGSDEPWSDVPPELEAMLRAQVAQKPAPSRVPARSVPAAGPSEVTQAEEKAAKPAPKPRAARKPSEVAVTAASAEEVVAAPASKLRAPRRPAAANTAEAVVVEAMVEAATHDVPAAKPRATRGSASAKAGSAKTGSATAEGIAADVDAAVPAAKPRATRKPAAPRKPAAKKAAATEQA